MAAKRYLADPTCKHIPILISLRNYSRAYDIEQLITDAVVNRYGVGLPAGYKTFARLNEAGRLLLIFDGFDEMERRVSDYRTTVENFWELAKVVCPASKVILTCRTAYFRHRGEEEKTLTPRHSPINVAAGDQVIDLHDREHFEVVYLLDFEDEDIKLALQKRLPARWEPVYGKIQELSNLRDLASRPVLLDMIVKTLPQIQDAREINQATLYEAYVDALLERRWSEDTDYIPPQGRLFFMQELAWEMYQTQKLTISFSEFPKRVTTHFGLEDDPEQAAFFERDVRTQSYLVRDDAGNYRFAHKSFMEYFVARKMASVVCDPGCDVEEAIEVWKPQPLAPEVRDFLLPMVADPGPLWRLVGATQDIPITDVGYAGGNAATLLRYKGESFVGAQLAGTILASANLFGADLTGANLQKAYLRYAVLSGCTLENSNLRGADLTGVQIEEMGSVGALAWSPDGKWLASGGADGIVRIWNIDHWTESLALREHTAKLDAIAWSPNSLYLATGDRAGNLVVWDTDQWDVLLSVRDLERIYSISFDPNSRRLAAGTAGRSILVFNLDSPTVIEKLLYGRTVKSVCYSPDGRYIAAGGNAYTLDIWDTRDQSKVFSRKLPQRIWSTSFSPCGQYVALGLWKGEIVIQSVQGFQGSESFRVHKSWVMSVAYSRDGKTIASGGSDKAVCLLDLTTGRIHRLGEHKQQVRQVAFHPNESLLVSASPDATIRIWDADRTSHTFGKCIRVLDVVMNCQGMRIYSAKGLSTPAPDGRGTLRDWLITRGAVE